MPKALLKILPISLLLLYPLVSMGQEPEGSFHVDTTGRLFVNPGEPVYLYISTQPDGSDAVRVRSMQPEGNPLRWDGHGVHFLTHLDLYLGRKIRFDLFADGHPPRTSTHFDATEGVQQGETIYLSGTSVLELRATDRHSGIAQTYVSVNEAGFTHYTEPLVLDMEGEYTIRFYSVDNVGNREDEGQRHLVIDTTPPATELEVDGPQHEDVVSGRTRFLLHPTDEVGVETTYYSINKGTEKRYTRPIAMAQLPEGEHTIEWYSTDIVGNREEVNSLTFFVDKTPPMVFEEIAGNTYMVAGREFSSGRSQLRIVAVDNRAGVDEIYYSINGAEFILYERPIYLSDITGAVSIRSYAIDNVGNKGESDAHGQHFSMPEIDITGPVINHSFTGPTLSLRDSIWISPSTSINIKAADEGSGVNRIEYSINSGQTETYESAFKVEKSGLYTVDVRAWDNVDNLNVASFEFGVDATGPEIFSTLSVKPHDYHTTDDGEVIPILSQGVILYLAATDDIAGIDRIMVSHNGAAETTYRQPISNFRTGQNHTVRIRAIDRLGNETEEVVRFRVE